VEWIENKANGTALIVRWRDGDGKKRSEQFGWGVGPEPETEAEVRARAAAFADEVERRIERRGLKRASSPPTTERCRRWKPS
jgi:hypothetical protein